jgi:hypothetical protein
MIGCSFSAKWLSFSGFISLGSLGFGFALGEELKERLDLHVFQASGRNETIIDVKAAKPGDVVSVTWSGRVPGWGGIPISPRPKNPYVTVEGNWNDALFLTPHWYVGNASHGNILVDGINWLYPVLATSRHHVTR